MKNFMAAIAVALLMTWAVAAGEGVDWVQTRPTETAIGLDGAIETADAWLAMIDGARERLDLGQFYLAGEAGSRCDEVIAALERAAGRGVAVRILVGTRMLDYYDELPDALQGIDGIEVRRIDWAALAGGVYHAKMILADGDQLYLGSANFDWRALEHIHELGLRLHSVELVTSFRELFDADWALAAGAGQPMSPVSWSEGVELDGVRILPVASPKDWLPPGVTWDWPELLALIDGAEQSLRIQVMEIGSIARDGSYWNELEDALKRAAVRGVEVRILVSHWARKVEKLPQLRSLAAFPGIEVEVFTVPEHSLGFIPFARVIHAKYVLADGQRFWIATSNLEKGYFYNSRNVGLIVDSAELGGELEAMHQRLWESPQAEVFDLCTDYPEPRRSE